MKKNGQQKANVWIDEHLSQYIYIPFYTLLLFYVQYLIPTNWWPVYSGLPWRYLPLTDTNKLVTCLLWSLMKTLT